MPNQYIAVPIDLHIAGALSAESIDIPSGTVTNDDISASADIVTTKMQHQHQPVVKQPLTAMTAGTEVLHVTKGATGTIVDFRCGSITAAVGAATATVDLKKNGVSVLTGTITLNNANTAYVPVNGTLSGTSLVVGDVLTVVTTATAGGGTLPTGFFATATIREKAA